MVKKMIARFFLSLPFFALPLISASGEEATRDVTPSPVDTLAVYSGDVSSDGPEAESEESEVYSDDSSGSVIELDEIVISATRTEVDILNAPAHITVVDEDAIKKMGAKDVSDVIAVYAGSSIRDYGLEGAQKSVTIRGASQQGVLVLIDGVRMNDSREGGMNLSLIPIHNIEKIEIVRGGTSALYGADAVGGIVNIITKKEADDKLRIRVENGSYIPRKSVKVPEDGNPVPMDADPLDIVDTQKVSIQYSKKAGPVDIVTSGSFTRANNAFVWNDTEYGYRKRVNADMLGGDAFAGISIPFGASKLEINGLFSYSKKGVPGKISGWSISTDARQTDMLANGYVHYSNNEFISDFLTFDIKANYKHSLLAYENPDETYPVDDKHQVRSFGVDMSQEVLYFDYFSILYGLNFNYDAADSTKTGKNERTSGGLFIESPLYMTPRFTLTPVLRYDYYSDFPNNFNFKLGGVYNISDTTSFKTSISKSYRAPTMNDLYWPYIPVEGTEGNPDLKPETAYGAEAGVTAIYDRFTYDIYIFTRFMKDEIQWNPDSDSDTAVWRPQNLGKTLYPGIEAGGQVNVISNLWLRAGYTFIYSFVFKDRDRYYTLNSNKRVPFVPVHAVDAGIEWQDPKNTAGLNAQLESKQYTNTANKESVEGYIVLDAHYERELTDNFTLLFSVKNLLNTTYETLDGYIMPPLFITAGVEAVF